jgi:hypothetical protein
MRLTIEPVRPVFPDRKPNERETPDRKPKKDTFDQALQDAKEKEDGRPNRGRA